MIALATVLCVIGAALLCLAMKRHFAQVFPAAQHDGRRATALRAVAYVLLFLSLVICIRAEGAGIGATLFFGLFTLAHFGLALLLPALPTARRNAR